MTEQPKPMSDEEIKARQALHCLHLEAPASVVADTKATVLDWVDAERARADAAEERIAELERQLAEAEKSINNMAEDYQTICRDLHAEEDRRVRCFVIAVALATCVVVLVIRRFTG